MATNPHNGEEPVTDPALTIDDPEKLSQNKRIKEILNRRSGVIDARNEAIDAYLTGELTKQQAITVYHSRIVSLILDLYSKFRNADDDAGEDYLYHDEIATVTIHPPRSLMPDSEHDLAAGASTPDSKTRTIEGLTWFVENDPVVTATFSVYRWNPPGEQSDINQSVLDFDTLDQAFMACMDFIDEAGIDADFADDNDDAEFDYSDLLDPDGDDPE